MRGFRREAASASLVCANGYFRKDVAGTSKERMHPSVFRPRRAALTDRGRGRPGITSRTQAAPSAARGIPQEHSLATSNAGRHSARIMAREDGRAHRQDADHQGQRHDLCYQSVPQVARRIDATMFDAVRGRS
jgi:hypothetical protein